MNQLKLNIPSDIRKISKAFRKSGKQLYVVGGAVRDAILGKTPKDFDLATDAKPEEVERIALSNGFKTLPLGKAFGVVVIQTKESPEGHEVATFRKDLSGGRRPDAVEYTDIYADVKRRDLTINALFYDIDKQQIVDLVGGIADLKKKQIRTVGVANDRFNEDPLRKLRAVRFAGSLGGKLERETFAALKKDPSLKGVSTERIRDEFIKGITKASDVKKYIALLRSVKLFDHIFPNMKINYNVMPTNDHVLQIANLLSLNDPLQLAKYLNKRSFTGSEVIDVVFLIRCLDFNSIDVYDIKRLQSRTSLSKSQVANWGKFHKNENIIKLSNFKLSVKGDEFMAKGLKGKEVGNAIKQKESELFLMSEAVIPDHIKTVKDLVKSAPADLQRRLMRLWAVPQNKEWHPEGNTLKHTILVMRNALNSNDIDLAAAALIHDLGKFETFGYHAKTRKPIAYGHEDVSAKLIKKYRQWIISLGGTPSQVYYLVKNHMKIKQFDKMRSSKQDKLKAIRGFDKLNKFNTIDNSGRGR